MQDFVHLHAHTQYSLLDGASGISASVQKCLADGQKALAITDHGNMFGAFKFFTECTRNGIKPIIGCETYVVEDRFKREFKGVGNKDRRYHQLLLAKNAKGYQNLLKLCSLGFIEGRYRGYPRIDIELIKKYSEGLIATTCCIGAQVPQAIINKGEAEGEKVFKQWLDIFGEDYYIELQRHGLKNIEDDSRNPTKYSQEDLNQILLGWAKKYKVKVIATNDSHYVEEEDAGAHDILLCLQTKADFDTPNRFKFPNNEFYLKSRAEMGKLFGDVPQALDNTMEIMDKVEKLDLNRDVLLPNYQIPDGFKTQADFVRHITFEGAHAKYDTVDAKVEERLNMELGIINSMGFDGYFLIVQDFIKAAKEMGVFVGPGRGSGAGSAVAYCMGITNVEPLKYNLLFERFLNPERVSMPDFDIDFDDEGRQSVIDYVVDKYGRDQVAQIVTYGTMGAKTAIRDVGRVMKVPLNDVNRIAKLVPEKPGTDFNAAFDQVPELRQIIEEDGTDTSTMLKRAVSLEGSIRHKGTHAAGVIIAPGNITDYVPVCTTPDSDLYITQFEGSIIEDAGMLKMDFLGLRTLTILKDALVNIKERHGVEIDLEEIPFDDEKTFELFQKGETVGIFQFESGGMQMYLKELKPDVFEDLISMNALYRPGPMDYIPSFIKRKHGEEAIEFPHEWLTDLLRPTYGIMVFQEQIMQAAQIMADFSLGSADILRRAMGKKKASVMEKQKILFVEGATKKGVTEKQANDVFNIMSKFAQYGFNRSHSAAYSMLSFQTAYLKTHYPQEFMAAVLTHNMNDTKMIYFFLNECNRMGIKTLNPDVNESRGKFTVNKAGQIRFGMAGIKGVGQNAVELMIAEREKAGPFTSIFDLTGRVGQRSVNRKCLENLAVAGAFDSFEGTHRAQYIEMDRRDGKTGVEKAVEYGKHVQANANSNQGSLFGEDEEFNTHVPALPDVPQWPKVAILEKEKEVTGIYLSGHPLNQYKREIRAFCNCRLSNVEKYVNHPLMLAGIVSSVEHRLAQSGNKYGRFKIEDYSGQYEISLYKEDYLKWQHMFAEGSLLFINASNIPSRWIPDRVDFKISSVELLENISSRAKAIDIVVPLENINDDLIAEMETLCDEFPGQMQVNMQVQSDGHLVYLMAISKTLRFSNDMFEKLEQMGIRKYDVRDQTK